MGDAPQPPLLTLRGLSVDYVTGAGSVRAVDAVSLAVAPGEVFGLAGESGSGKSTLVHALMRTLGPPGVITGGAVEFQGRDVLAMDDEALRRFRWHEMSLVFQSALNALNPVATIGEQLVDTLRAHVAIARQEAFERGAQLLEMVGLQRQDLTRYPHQLSGGMRQRAVIAIALALNPKLLIMDEPTTALDVVVERQILQRVLRLKSKRGFSILFITHDLPLMLEISDRIGIIYAGRLVEIGPAATLRQAALHPYTQGLMKAFPTLAGPRTTLTGIAGAPPSLAEPPSGCRFHPRCPLAEARCRTNEPRWVALDATHGVACHLIDSAASEP